MALDAHGHFNQLLAFLDEDYLVEQGNENEIILKDEAIIDEERGIEGIELSFPFIGEAFVVNLDMTIQKKEDGEKSKKPFSPQLFRFLKDDAKAWAKKCDYVIFHRVTDELYAYCIELKSKGITAETIEAQLGAGYNWVRSLKKVIEHYTGHEMPIKVQKFIFSSTPNPERYTLPDGKYLERNPTIRLYTYNELEGLSLADLENRFVDAV